MEVGEGEGGGVEEVEGKVAVKREEEGVSNVEKRVTLKQIVQSLNPGKL